MIKGIGDIQIINNKEKDACHIREPKFCTINIFDIYSLVKPFQTGTPAYFANSSTISWPKPRYSIASNILPKTRAVSGILSFLPIWEPEGSKYVVPHPKSWAANSIAHLVLVLFRILNYVLSLENWSH